MSTKFNKWGQWSLGADGGGTTLIKGIQPTGQQVSNRSEPSSGLTGADIAKIAMAQAEAGKLPEMNKAQPQPTNEQMFGGGVVTEEQAEAAKKDWDNTFNKHFSGFNVKIDHLNKSKVEGSWGLGKSFNSMLSKEELAARNGHVGED